MQQLDGFDVARIAPRPWRLRAMHKMYGRDPEHACGHCRHLIVKQYAGTYFKCALTRQTAGPGTDWRTGWQACGRFEKRGEEA